MVLEASDHTLSSFTNYLIDRKDVLLRDKVRNELMVYLFLVNRPWESFFPKFEVSEHGDLKKATIPSPRFEGESDTYYAFEYGEGVALVFSLTTKKDYELALQKIVRRKRGVMELWIRPGICRKIQEYILEEYPEAQITYFVAKREPRDVTPSRHRGRFKRRLSYTGDDGRDVLEEVQYLYGVLPTSISYEIGPSLKLKVYEDGLLILRTINRETFDLMRGILDIVAQDIEGSRLVASQMNADLEILELEGGDIKVPSAIPGEIVLSNKLDEDTAREFVESAEGFSFLDVEIRGGSLVFSATVVDNDKGSVFGLSASESMMRLVPRFNPTFETYLKFCRQVIESVDENAVLQEA